MKETPPEVVGFRGECRPQTRRNGTAGEDTVAAAPVGVTPPLKTANLTYIFPAIFRIKKKYNR